MSSTVRLPVAMNVVPLAASVSQGLIRALSCIVGDISPVQWLAIVLREVSTVSFLVDEP